MKQSKNKRMLDDLTVRLVYAVKGEIEIHKKHLSKNDWDDFENFCWNIMANEALKKSSTSKKVKLK